MLTIPEKSRQGFAFHFEDENRLPFAPLTIRYRVHDAQTDTELLGWDYSAVLVTEPDGRGGLSKSTTEIILPASVNRILNTSNAYETRILTVQSDYDTDDQLSQEESYRVRNLSGFS